MSLTPAAADRPEFLSQSKNLEMWAHGFAPARGRQGQVDLCGFEDTEAEHVPGWLRLHRETPPAGRGSSGDKQSKRFNGSLL